MVKTRLTFIAASLLLVSCGGGHSFTCEFIPMDGHRAGVSAVTGTEIDAALGTVDSVYTSPSGKRFGCGSTPVVAAAMIAAQPALAHLKEVVGYAPEAMVKAGPECELWNWAADVLRAGCGKICGKPVDISIINTGGIRTDMPAGNVTKDDIVSMFPFNNYLSVVELKGSDVRALFEGMAADNMQAFSGVRALVRSGRLESLEVGGEPLDEDRTYRVGTIDFLLDGGDGIYVARNALSLEVSGVSMKECVITYLQDGQSGVGQIKGEIEGRVVVK